MQIEGSHKESHCVHIATECRLKVPTKKATVTNLQNHKQKKIWKKKEVGEMKVECKITLYAKDKQSQWYVDSGCSKHMIGDPNKFISFEMKQKGKVTFGYDVSAKIIGKGTMTLGNNKTKAKDVLLVEDIKPNLLSVSQTCDQGNIFIFDYDKCEIWKNDT